MSDVKLAFGLRGEELLHVSQVDRGLKCNCRCPGCKAELVARKGDETAHHFAHRARSDCLFQPETALHDYSKRLIARQLRFTSPALYVVVQENSYGLTTGDSLPAKDYSVRSGEIEKGFREIIPDVQLDTDVGLIFVEVAVTHFVDRNKRSKLRNYGIPTIEIDLSSVALDTPLEGIERAVLSDMSLRKWVYHPDEFELQSRLRDKLQKMVSEYELEFIHKGSDEYVLDENDRYEDEDGEGWALLLQAIDQYNGEITHEWLQSIPQNKRVDNYKTISHLEKLTYHCFLLERRPETLPLLFNRRDSAGPPFLCPSIVWRTGVFFRFITANAKKLDFGPGDVVRWCRARYETFSFGAIFDATDSADQTSIDIEGEVTGFLLELEREGYLESDGFIARRRRFTPAMKLLPKWNRLAR